MNSYYLQRTMAPSKLTPMGLLVYLWCFSVLVMSTWGAKVEYKWEVKYMRGAPDCVEKDVIGINSQFPGPTIKARAGDTVVVHLTNTRINEGVVIHWHGIRQIGTPWFDGTASISQCPIEDGETFTYEFLVDKAGTYFYHGHLGMQRSAGLYGMLIVDVENGKKEPFDYDGEFSLLLSDWWHKDIKEQEDDLNAKPMRWIGEPQSLLINGRGLYGCTLAPSPTSDSPGQPTALAPAPSTGGSSLRKCNFVDRPLAPAPPPTGGGSTPPVGGDDQLCKPIILDVEPDKTYRLRVASTTALASLNLAIGDHEMEIVEADANYVERVSVTDFDIYSGESYSVLLHTKKDTSNNFWISVGVRGRKPGTPPALAVLRYKSSPNFESPTVLPPTTPRWDDYSYSKSFSNKIVAHSNTPKPPKGNPIRQIYLLNTQNLINGSTKWAINNVSLSLPSTTPYLGSITHGLVNAFDQGQPPETFVTTYDITKPPPNPNATNGSRVYMLELGKTIDVILQNANVLNTTGVSEIHPWHLHGHDFWVLGYGDGMFSKDKDEKNLNTVNPPYRNTAVIFPHGWTVLRFVADNPGVWAFHCHIEPHLHMGMGVIFAEGIDQIDKDKVTPKALACSKGLSFSNSSQSSQSWRVSPSMWIGLSVGIGFLCQLLISG